MSNQTNTAYYNKLNSDISVYFVIISSSIGIPLNLVNIIVFAKLMHQKTNMGFLCTFQALVDLLLLLVFLFLTRSSPLIFPQSLDTVSEFLCKLIKYMRRLPLHISSWMNVIITFDRFVFILYGNGQKFKFMKKKSCLAAIILVVIIALSTLDMPNLMFYLPSRTLSSNGTLGPVTTCVSTFPVLLSADIISMVFRTYIPICIMLFFNALMIRKIFHNSRETFRQNSLSRKELQFTIAVIAFDAYFFILAFPLSVFYIFYDVNYYSGMFTINPEFGAYYNMILNLIINVSVFVPTFSFFMNFAFNKVFRQTLLELTGRIFRIESLRQIYPSSEKSNSTQTHARMRINTIC